MDIEKIELYIKFLESHGFDMKSVWIQHRKIVEQETYSKPDTLDLQYICPNVKPLISEHVWRGQKQVLSPTNMFQGYSYTLSPGQRQWLKDNYSLTPTETVTVINLGIWPGNHPKAITIRSDEHVDYRRRHVLVQCIINRPGKFFHEAQQLDALIEQMKPRRATIHAITGSTITVMCEGIEIKNVKTEFTKMQVGDEVMVAWSSKEDKETKEVIEQWKMTKHITSQWYGVSSSKRTAPTGQRMISLGSLMEELKQGGLL